MLFTLPCDGLGQFRSLDGAFSVTGIETKLACLENTSIRYKVEFKVSLWKAVIHVVIL